MAVATCVCSIAAAATVGASTQKCPALAPFIVSGAPLALRQATDRQPLAILAIGSSSTEGVAASSPDRAYPAQLARDLGQVFRVDAQVLNAGVGGETAAGTLVRLEAALRERPVDLVIWQVGTNDALTGRDEASFRAEVDQGLSVALAKKTPIVLMDPQLMVSRLHDERYARYAEIVRDEGARFHLPVVSRFEMMQSLADSRPEAWKSLLSGDGVHMNDLGYACVALSLARPIAEAEHSVVLATH